MNYREESRYTTGDVNKARTSSRRQLFDNYMYDENSEALSAAGTFHDTVGICYQNRMVGDSTVRENTSATNNLYKTNKNRKNRKKKPYRIKAKI